MSTQEELLREVITSLGETSTALKTSARAQLEATAAQIAATDPARAANLERAARDLAASSRSLDSSASRVEASGASAATSGGVLGTFLGTASDALGEVNEQMGNFESRFIRGDMLADLERIQTRFGGIAGDNARNFREGITFGSRYSQMLLGFDRQIRGAESSVSGLGMSITDLLGGPDSAYAVGRKFFGEMVDGAGASADGFLTLKTANESLATEMALFGTRMELTPRQTRTFVSRMIDLTGQASSDMLRDSSVYAQRVADATGDSGKEILTVMEQIVQESENFGNVLPEEAAKIAGTLRQLGIDFRDFNGMTQRYLNFESAARSVSALTSVFGVQIDAMEMMRLANEDQFTFLMRMRDSFLMTAKSVDDMSQAELRLIQSQLGLGSESAVRRLLDPDADIMSMQDITEAAGGEVENMDTALQELQDQIARFGRTTAGSIDQYARSLEMAAVTNTQRSLLSAAAIYQEHYNQVLGMHEMAIQQLADDEAGQALLGGMDSAIMQNLPPLFEGVVSGISDAMELLLPVFNDLLTELRFLFEKAGWLEESPSKMGLSMWRGLYKAGEATLPAIGDQFERMASLSNTQFSALVGNVETEVGKVSERIGQLGIEFGDLTTEDIAHYVEQFRLGTGQDAVDRLEIIMRRHANADAISTRNRSDAIMGDLATLQGYSDDYIAARISELSGIHDISTDILRTAMGDTEDSSNAIFNALRGREQSEAQRSANAEATAGEVSTAQQRTGEATDRVAASNTAILTATRNNGGKLDTLNGKIDQLITATRDRVRAKTEITVPLTVDGRVIASVVAEHADDPSARSSDNRQITTEEATVSPE